MEHERLRNKGQSQIYYVIIIYIFQNLYTNSMIYISGLNMSTRLDAMYTDCVDFLYVERLLV